MKKLLLICLLAGYGPCFAQNIDLKDLLRIQDAPTVDFINQLLSPKGYSLPKETENLIWSFKSDANPDAPDVAQLYRVTDTVGNKLIYETANRFFYTYLVNQLPGNGFQFKQTTAGINNLNLVFSNGGQEVLLNVAQDNRSATPYRITLQPASSLRTSLPQKYNHKVRMNSY